MTGFHTLWTIALVVIFVLIARWAWSPKRENDFRQAANLPFEEGRETSTPGSDDRGVN